MTTNDSSEDNDDYEFSPSYYNDIMNDPESYATEYQVLTELRSKYGDTISKRDYLVKLHEISNTVVAEWESYIEKFTEYGDGTVFVERKATTEKCGWCGIELGNDVLAELCSSCNKLPKKKAVNGPFTDTELYLKGNEKKGYRLQHIEYSYMIDDD